MGRFDVYANRQGAGWLLDVQSDLIASLNTRVVVPLLPVDEARCRQSGSTRSLQSKASAS